VSELGNNDPVLSSFFLRDFIFFSLPTSVFQVVSELGNNDPGFSSFFPDRFAKVYGTGTTQGYTLSLVMDLTFYTVLVF
jgi:hypothetical protein